nr:elongation factor Tu, mitochondrial [Tanacetum cinerariifolium]
MLYMAWYALSKTLAEGVFLIELKFSHDGFVFKVLVDEEKAKAIAFDEINKSPKENKRGLTVAIAQVAEKTVPTLDVLHGHACNLCVQNRTRKEMQGKITGLSSQSAVLTTYGQELMVELD